MKRTILRFIVQVAATAAIYILTLWLFNAIFDKEYGFEVQYLIQGIIFAVIFVPFTNWNNKRKAAGKSKASA